MAYVKHKPQYRNVRTPNAADFGRPRDIRRALPDARGKVILPDKSGLPRRFGGVPKRAPAFGKAGYTFSPPAMKAKPPSSWWRGGAAQLAPVMRNAMWFMAAYDIYRSVEEILGGEPYVVPGDLAGGGPGQWSYVTGPNPERPGQFVVFPTPDGLAGWSWSASARWYQGFDGKGSLGSSDRWLRFAQTPWGRYHRPPANASGSYWEADVYALGAPPAPTVSGGNINWRAQNRLEDGGWATSPVSWSGSLKNPALNWSKVLPNGAPAPQVTTDPALFPFPVPDLLPGTIADLWPGQAARPSLLPWGNPWVPLPWGAVNAVNALKGAIGIREENFLDDVGMPRPEAKPEVIHKPPPRGQKEKKARSNNGRLLLFYRAVKKAWHEADEYVEKVDILYDALPGWVRNQERAKLPHEKIAAIIRNLQHIDVADAVYGLIENEVEDAAFGRGFRSLEQAFERMGVRGWRGDLAMGYSTDALFELYGALKGGL